MNKRILYLLLSLFISSLAIARDLKRNEFKNPSWRIGLETTPGFVLKTNGFLKGINPEQKQISTTLSGDIRVDFSFSPYSRNGQLYKGLYQGIGVGSNSYFSSSLLGNPFSVYVYQGAPIFHFNNKLSLGYEWQFGAAFGWKHYDGVNSEYNSVASTSTTAHMGLSVKLNYALSSNWILSAGFNAKHFSNGNTSWPNAGLNTIGTSIGVTYQIDSNSNHNNGAIVRSDDIANKPWMFDISAYGAWRKRTVIIGDNNAPQMCPGKFGVIGFQFSPLYRINRYLSIGPSLDPQWDESGGIQKYWVKGTTGDNIKFERPPFIKQISLGTSAHAELTMPIFSVNVGLGYDLLNPKGNKAFYQSLTLKTFITEKIYLNTGYRLGNFKDPQNLMLGIGVRL